uniref:F-box protein family n=1 Tax=Solanum tuberosum TaxID=4113 RepID=M0ZX89_SOLTU
MEGEKYDLWSEHVPTDILKLISSRLVAGDYFAFCAVCKAWRQDPLPPQLHLHHDDEDDSPSPFLMTLHKETGIVEFFNPVYNALIIPTMVISKLKGSRIRSSKANWLLMSHGNRGMFFFNPKSNDIIELPDLPLIHNCFSAWTFSCPPDSSSSSCFVVGFDEVGSPPDVYIIKVGDTTWTYHYFVNELRNCQGLFSLLGCNNPVFFKNNIVSVLGDKGTLGILTINENSAAETPSWQFYGTPFWRTKQMSIREVYTVEDVDNRGMLAVFLTHEQGKVEVWSSGVKSDVCAHQSPNVYSLPETAQDYKDGKDDDLGDIDELVNGGYMKLLNLDNDADEESYRLAIERPLSPTLPEIQYHSSVELVPINTPLYEGFSNARGTVASSGNFDVINVEINFNQLKHPTIDPPKKSSLPEKKDHVDSSKRLNLDTACKLSCSSYTDTLEALCRSDLAAPTSEGLQISSERRVVSLQDGFAKYCVIFSNNNDENSISSVYHATSRCLAQCSASSDTSLRSILVTLLNLQEISNE